jgi:hypothetical protein
MCIINFATSPNLIHECKFSNEQITSVNILTSRRTVVLYYNIYAATVTSRVCKVNRFSFIGPVVDTNYFRRCFLLLLCILVQLLIKKSILHTGLEIPITPVCPGYTPNASLEKYKIPCIAFHFLLVYPGFSCRPHLFHVAKGFTRPYRA